MLLFPPTPVFQESIPLKMVHSALLFLPIPAAPCSNFELPVPALKNDDADPAPLPRPLAAHLTDFLLFYWKHKSSSSSKFYANDPQYGGEYESYSS